MDFLELAEKRCSMRQYKHDPIPQACIDKILLAGRAAPTAHNNQPQEIIVVRSEAGLRLLDQCTVCHYGAPLAFIVCYDRKRAWIRDYDGKSSGDTDASIVATHMMLEAEALGIASTWIMYFIPEAVTAEFDLPDETVPVAILYLGYADGEASPAHSSRREPGEYVTYR